MFEFFCEPARNNSASDLEFSQSLLEAYVIEVEATPSALQEWGKAGISSVTGTFYVSLYCSSTGCYSHYSTVICAKV
jgi:hypothetical protein